MNEIAKHLNAYVPERNAPPPGTGHRIEVDTGRLKKLAGPADELQRDVKAGVAKMQPDSDQAARDLGADWATSAKLREITADWDAQLHKLADQIGAIGPKLVASANNHLLAETVNRQAVQAVAQALESWRK